MTAQRLPITTNPLSNFNVILHLNYRLCILDEDKALE